VLGYKSTTVSRRSDIYVIGNELTSEIERGQAEPTADSVIHKMRPFFGFYGGKWRDAVKYYPTPHHGRIVEPFAGSAGYSLRYADRDVILGERDPIIASVWEYLIRATPKDILSIPDVPTDGSVDDLGVCQEARWLVGFWMNRGASRPRKKPSKWMREGLRPGSFWGDRVRTTIAAQVEQIRHWKIYFCSWEDLPVSGDATWFVDPPYQLAGKHYRYGSESIDYTDLGAWCRTLPGQVIVCENKGADWMPFRPLASTKTTRANRRSEEVVWIRDGAVRPSD
jgi:hypothetical protein